LTSPAIPRTYHNVQLDRPSPLPLPRTYCPDTNGVESGRIAVVPMRHPMGPPLGEYCAAIWTEGVLAWNVVVTFNRDARTYRNIERILVLPESGILPPRAALIGTLHVRQPWLVVGDLGFCCRRSAQGVDTQLSREYSRAKDAVESHKRIGGVYWVAERDFGVAVHVPDLEARYSVIEENGGVTVETEDVSKLVDLEA
jgi:hypothetical protein